jgi:hypothetical protein
LAEARGATCHYCSDDTKAVQHCSRGFLCVFVVTFRWCVYLDIIVFDLFWIFVICFTCKNCVCKKQNKKRKGKEKENIEKVHGCVCICFRDVLFLFKIKL